jgi:acyl carrier protein
LDFFALFSSTAAFNGTIGEVGYCAANAFQDAFALYMKDKQDTFTFTISINWDAWLEVGQAVKTVQRLSELYHADFKNIIKHGILPKEGIEVFNRVTAGEYPQVAISTREFELGSTQQDTPEKEKSTSDAGSTPVKGNKKSTVSIYAKPRPNLSAPYIEPSTQLEQILAELWKKLFDYDRVGVRDDFFRLGGDSLKAITVIANIHKKVDVKIPLAEIFKYPTIREIAAFIKSKQKDKYVSIKPLEKRPYYDVSYAQNRVWVLSQIEEASVAFNMITANLLEGDLDKQAFDKSFVTLVERHESLRTIFVQVEGKVKQKILSADEVNFKIDFVDLKEYKARVWKSREKKIMAREANTPFDLSKGPLLKVILIRHQDRKYLFLFKMHHIIGDLLSNNVINREVLTLYNVYRKGEDNLLKPLRIHYKDYAAWQNRQLTGEYLEQHREYWLRQFKHPSPAPVLRLPTDKPRPEIQTYNGNLLGHAIVDPLASALRTLSDQQDATMFMTFLAALNVLMYQYTNQTDIVIGTPIAGREHADLENQIGFYLNTLALRTCFAEDDTFLTLLAKIRKVTWGAFEHQDFPFDKLVQELGEKRDVSRHPLFDVMLDMAKLTSLDPLTPLTTTKNPKSKLDLKMMPSKTGYRSCKFDLTVYIFEEKNFINMVFEYNTDLFEKSTIERMKKRFRLLLDRIVKNPHTLVADFDLEEEHQIPGIDTSARSRYTL